jgi:hypothetical protein
MLTTSQHMLVNGATSWASKARSKIMDDRKRTTESLLKIALGSAFQFDVRASLHVYYLERYRANDMCILFPHLL